MRGMNKLSTTRILLLALLLSVAFFVVMMILALLAWSGLRLAGVNADLWAMLESVAATAAVAQVFGGGLVALWQLKASIDSRNLDIFNNIFDKLMSERNIEARRWIYQNLPDKPEQGLASLDSQGHACVRLVLDSLDHLGFLIMQDWVAERAEEAVIAWVSPFVVKIWEKLGAYIEHELEHRPSEPDYYEAAIYLAKRCVAWRRKHMPAEETIWRHDAL